MSTPVSEPVSESESSPAFVRVPILPLKVTSFIEQVRDLESKMLQLLEESSKCPELNLDKRWCSIAKTHVQEGRMAAVRSATEK